MPHEEDTGFTEAAEEGGSLLGEDELNASSAQPENGSA